MMKSRETIGCPLRIVFMVPIALFGILLVVVVGSVNADCCGPVCDGFLGIGGRCGDCTVTYTYCGYGPCNIFGCNCDGGCRTGRCSHQWGVSAADMFKTIDSNGDNRINITEANDWIKAKGSTKLDVAKMEISFKEMDTNRNGVIDPGEFDSGLAEGVVFKSKVFTPKSAPEGYWSEKRIRETEPFPMPRLTDEDVARMKYYPPAVQEGVQKIEGSKEKQTKGEISNNLSAAEGEIVYADVHQRPYWNGGKLFFTTPAGDSACTAEFVGSNRVIMTAAHCVVDTRTGQPYSNFSFRQAYENYVGKAFSLTNVTYPAQYIGGNYAYDYAFACASDISGAGWLGFWSYVPFDSYTAIGYSTNYKCGHVMSQVIGDKGTVGSGVVQMKNNPMAPGCSGGAWIGDLFTPYVRGNWAIGLNSFIFLSDPSTVYGPLFDSNTSSMLHSLMQTCK
jgi:hypothetical protein